ncbi:MAG: 6-phosphofructokinase, partial [Bacteroidales bacterium]
QRGGAPSCSDRVLASRLGYEGVLALNRGEHGVMIGLVNNKVNYVPFAKAVKQHSAVSPILLEMARVLSL